MDRKTIKFEYPSLDFTNLKRYKRIAIDGDLGAGKSTLALNLALAISARVVHLDCFLLGNGNSYLEQLDYSKLARSLACKHDRCLIVEGVCLLSALKRVGFEIDFLIFCKKYDFGRWQYDGLESGTGKTLISDRRAKEVEKYYREFRPFAICNEVICRDEDYK